MGNACLAGFESEFELTATYRDQNMVLLSSDESAFSRDNIFKDMRNNGDFFDVTLASEDSQVEAHRVLLSTVSTVLQKILKRNPLKHPIIFLRGTTKKQLDNILDFIYNGSVEVELCELDAFMELAVDLKIKGIDKNQKMSRKEIDKVELVASEQDNSDTNKDTDLVMNSREDKGINALSLVKTKKASVCTPCQAPLSSDVSEIWFHKTLCYYNQGVLFSKFPPGPQNSDEAGKPLDEVGVEIFYSCSELHCCYTDKKLGYKEFVLHQAMCHRMLEGVIMEEQQDGVDDGLNEVLLTKNGYRYRAECFKSKIKALKLGQGRKRLRR